MFVRFPEHVTVRSAGTARSPLRTRRLSGTESFLLIEDDPDDAFLIQRRFRKDGVENPVTHLQNSTEARDYLRRCMEQTAGPPPFLIILSMDLVDRGAIPFLEWLRGHREFGRTIVIAMGKSARAADFQPALDAGANGYYAKELDLSGLANMLKELEIIELSPAEPASEPEGEDRLR